jgi:signal recognition particle GTPase
MTLGGTVLYHKQSANSILIGDKENSLSMINLFISSILLDNKSESNREVLSFNEQNVVAEWLDGSKSKIDGAGSDWIVLVLYPDVALRKMSGVDALLSSLMKRYALFYDHHMQDQNELGLGSLNLQLYIPPRTEFDNAYETILRRFQDQLSNNPHNKQLTHKPNSQKGSSNNLKKKGKEKTVWHDGKGKVTKEALASLDMSKDAQDPSTTLGPGEIREDSRAIAEARVTYMPSNDEKPAWEEEDETDFDIQWGDVDVGKEEEEQASGLRGFFSKLLTPNAPLTKTDLEPPLKQMKELLTSKNVAISTAQAICDVVERQLLGKKVGTMVGVKRAVRHALEDAVERILRPELGGIGSGSVKRGKSVDVLRGVVEKREKGKGMLGLGSSNQGGRPFVIVMIGINGEFCHISQNDLVHTISLYSWH